MSTSDERTGVATTKKELIPGSDIDLSVLAAKLAALATAADSNKVRAMPVR